MGDEILDNADIEQQQQKNQTPAELKKELKKCLVQFRKVEKELAELKDTYSKDKEFWVNTVTKTLRFTSLVQKKTKKLIADVEKLTELTDEHDKTIYKLRLESDYHKKVNDLDGRQIKEIQDDLNTIEPLRRRMWLIGITATFISSVLGFIVACDKVWNALKTFIGF